MDSLANNHSPYQAKLITQVEQLFKENTEALNYNKVIELSSKIINFRSHYPSETVAKTYLLLAYVAINKGELEIALQFSNDGLAIANQNKETRLSLQINLAKILLAKKHYQQLLTMTQQVINTPENKKDTHYFLVILSYRSIALAIQGQYKKALIDLQQVENIIKKNPTFYENIPLLTILGNAYYYLGDYQTALTVHINVLKLRFNLNELNNIDQTYFYLANAYYRLNKFDDAYTAYWEAKNHAIKKDTPIYIAYASQRLALTLLHQKQYNTAEIEALQAKKLFYKHNLTTPYVESIIVLTQIYHATKKENKKFTQLLKIEKLLANIKLTADYTIIYQYIAEMYLVKQDLNKAYYWQNKYSKALFENKLTTNKIKKLDSYPIDKKVTKNQNSIPANKKTRAFGVSPTEQNKLTSAFLSAYNTQLIILTFIITILTLLVFIIILLIKVRKKKLLSKYETLKNPSYILANSIQTKQLYQTSFNMAKKYNYPLTLGYLSITNWQELTFRFNQKTVSEISRGIAHLINEQLSEFENSELVNDGEYLLFFPYQHKENVIQTIEKLVSALKLRFFANLGEFSLIIAYSIESPEIQDIDPYIFLSKLRDSIKLA